MKTHYSSKRVRLYLAMIGVTLAFFLPVGLVPAAEFYVSPHGKDANLGSKAQPFQTLERARAAVRASNDRGREPVTVWLRRGRYHLAATFELNEEDSGTKGAPVIYKASPGEKVFIDGGKVIPRDACEPATDPEVLARLVPEIRDKVLQIDLESCDLTEYGSFGPRGFGRKLIPAPAELFINHQPQQVARWPNDKRIRLGKVIDKGSVPRFGDKDNRGGVFKCENPRVQRWAKAQDLYISGIFGESWADDTIGVAKIDIAQKTITTVEPHLYGFKNRPFTTWCAVNLLEEIDTPGEYFLDRKTGRIYFYPSVEKIEMVQVSQLASPMLSMIHTSYGHIEGLIFENSRGVGIRIEGGESNRIAGCKLRLLGGTGITINGGGHHAVLSCDIYDTGAGGVSLAGGDRRSLTPANHVVKNCDIHHVNRWYQTYNPCVRLNGVGNRAANNHLHHVPGQAILFGGNDHVMEFNEIDNCVTDMSDMGAIYTGRNPSVMGHIIRHNFFHHLYNRLGSGYGVQAIFIDDDSLYTAIIYGNVFFKAGSNGVIKFNGGGGSTIGNNVSVDGPQFVLGGYRKDVDRAIGEMQNPRKRKCFPDRMFKEVDVREEPFRSRYPYLLDSYTNGFNYGTPQWNNLLVDSSDVAAMEQFVDAKNMNFELKPDAPIMKTVAKSIYDRVYGLDHENVAFKPIPFKRIGLYADEFRETVTRQKSKD